MDNQITKKLSKKYFGKVAKEYNNDRSGDLRGEDMLKKEFKIFEKFLHVPFFSEKGEKILDVGCGTGVDFRCYGEREIYGVDISRDMLKYAQEKRPDAKLRVLDARKLPYPDEFFDVTITNRFICHIPEYKKVIKEMVRVTKRGGVIIIDFPNKNSLSSITTKYRLKKGKLAYYNLFSYKDIEALAKQNRLWACRIQSKAFFPPRMFPKWTYPFFRVINNFLAWEFPKLSTPMYVKFVKEWR